VNNGFEKDLEVRDSDFIEVKKVKTPLLQAVEALRVARGRGSHIT
jgi:hypothetical protein